MAETTTVGVLEGRREFKDPITGQSYFISPPNAEDVRGADWQYSKTFTKCLVEGITTSAEMMDILMRRGVIGPEYEQRQKELTDDLARKVEGLRSSKNMDEKQQLAVEVSNARGELFNWNQRLNGPMSNTCEQMADDARLEFLASRMIQLPDGKKVWDAYSDFLTEKNQRLAMRARFEVMLYLQGLEPDFLEKTPEAVAIREIEAEIQQKANDVLEELNRVTQASEPEPGEEIKPKKRGSKKSSE
jgi:hypothetical protein